MRTKHESTIDAFLAVFSLAAAACAVLAAYLIIDGAYSRAYGQEHHHHPPQDADLHEKFYSTWKIPNGGQPRWQSCCSKEDCYPTQVKKVRGTWYALRREDGQWIPVPDSKIEQLQSDPVESPDESTHVCMPKPGGSNGIYCITLGSGT